MKNVTLNSQREFKKLFHGNFQPYKIKFVNNIAVNCKTGALTGNELKVTNNHVTLSTYSVELGETITKFIEPPYHVMY